MSHVPGMRSISSLRLLVRVIERGSREFQRPIEQPRSAKQNRAREMTSARHEQETDGQPCFPFRGKIHPVKVLSMGHARQTKTG